MRHLLLIPILVLLGVISQKVFAQEAMENEPADPVAMEPEMISPEMSEPNMVTEPAGGFEQLSPGNKMIARALLDAQIVPADGTQAWNLDQITAAKSETGWGNVFKQMRAEGLIEAKNLGEVVSGHAINTHAPIPDTAVVEVDIPVEESAAAEPSEAGPEEAAMTESPEQDVAGSFEQLSPGNKKIARSLMDAQVAPADGNQAWNLDQIAAAKPETGWGQVFQQMQAEGLIEAKNLGQVVSQYQLNNTAAVTTGTEAALATAATTPASERIPDHAHGNNGPGAGNAKVDVNNQVEVGVVTTADQGNGANVHVTTATGGNAQGNAFGVRNNISVSASEGVTTGTGATVSTGAGNTANISAIGGTTGAAGGHANVNAGANAASHSAAAASVTTSAGGASGAGQGFAHGHSK